MRIRPMINKKCERCGKTSNEVKIFRFDLHKHYPFYDYEGFDICEDCEVELYNLMNNFLNVETKKMEIINDCCNCGREDTIGCETGLCSKCRNKTIELVSNNEEVSKEISREIMEERGREVEDGMKETNPEIEDGE